MTGKVMFPPPGACQVGQVGSSSQWCGRPSIPVVCLVITCHQSDDRAAVLLTDGQLYAVIITVVYGYHHYNL